MVKIKPESRTFGRKPGREQFPEPSGQIDEDAAAVHVTEGHGKRLWVFSH